MSDLILRTATKAEIARFNIAQTFASYVEGVVERARREQTGQDMVEYAGVLVVVAAIIGAMFTFGKPIASAIDRGVSTEITKIFSN